MPRESPAPGPSVVVTPDQLDELRTAWEVAFQRVEAHRIEDCWSPETRAHAQGELAGLSFACNLLDVFGPTPQSRLPLVIPWATTARGVLRALAASGEEFTADELLALVGPPDLEGAPNGANSGIGGIFGRASREGLIVAVGLRRSTQPKRRGGMIRVWQGVEGK